jgi:hypothetical protein
VGISVGRPDLEEGFCVGFFVCFLVGRLVGRLEGLAEGRIVGPFVLNLMAGGCTGL